MPGSPLAAPREMRFRWYRQAEKYRKTIPEISTIFGISKKTYHKWYNRDHGYASNQYRARKEHPQTKITPEIRCAIVTAKTQYNYGPAKMRLYVQTHHGITISTTAIYKFFKKKRLIRKPQRQQPWYTPMTEPFHATMPGENVQYDVKYVPAVDGTWNYQFRLTDTVTRIQYALDCLDKSSTAAVAVFRKAAHCFPFPITGIQTDNGSEFRGWFARYLQQKKIIHRFIPKRSAPWNGIVERANRSVDDEYYLNGTRPWKTLAEYIRWFNTERPHLGYGMYGMTPIQKFNTYTTQRTQNSHP